MRLSAMRIIVDNPHHARNGEEGIIQSTTFHSERGFYAAVRFGDRIESISSKDFKIHPDDVERMDTELAKERAFFIGSE